MYDNGQGVARDYAEAARWSRKAADQGVAEAQFNLGVMHDNGRGVARDYAEAARWLRKAADQGFARAQCMLGLKYYDGQGATQDYVQSYMWMNLAASRANGDDQKEFAKWRDFVAKKMSPQQISVARRQAAQWKPKTEAGNVAK
jgi:TPR repeat protein